MITQKKCEWCTVSYAPSERFHYNGYFHKQAWTNSRFCGNKCSALSRSGETERKETKKCAICGMLFLRKYKYSNKQWENAKYCSKKCRATSVDTRVLKQCLECGNTFKVKQYIKNVTKHCSNSCKLLWTSKHGKTPQMKRLRKSKAFADWRKAVFERDDYTCQMCAIRGGELHPDHIKQFAYYPELRFDVSNGRTLCASCHKKTPTWGRRLTASTASKWIEDFEK